MSGKKVYTDTMHGWMVTHVCDTMIAGSRHVFVKLKVVGSEYSYFVKDNVFDSDRFEEVE